MINLQKRYIDYSLFDKYDEDYLVSCLIIPFYEDEFVLQLATCKESVLIDTKIKFSKQLIFKEFSRNEIEFYLSNLMIRKELNFLENKILNSQKSDNSLESFFNQLISFSIQNRSSDIHFEVNQKNCFVRFRIDGKMISFFTFKKDLFRFLSSYIKLISNLDITQIRLPMDSRFSLNIENIMYDFRISTMPTIDGESIVIRILDKKNINKSLDSLGFSRNIQENFKDVLNLTQGLVLITGPTGSGKTTTLYSILKELNQEEKKIITVEDPVEYKIENISQISVNNKIGLNFEVILKNILRQDPDVIFIGEIRDKFSLDIALQASLTGHLVIATIHSNSAIQTITRLLDLKADTFLLSTTLKYILSQRLVLNYCKYCKAKGCKKCNFTKYYDRSSIGEILYVDDEISSMIFNKVEINQMKKYLKQINFKTILEDGLNKVEENVTSLNEVYKVV